MKAKDILIHKGNCDADVFVSEDKKSAVIIPKGEDMSKETKSCNNCGNQPMNSAKCTERVCSVDPDAVDHYLANWQPNNSLISEKELNVGIKEQAPCQHQWATTLLYIPEGSKDRNITKCMKCGIEQAPAGIVKLKRREICPTCNQTFDCVDRLVKSEQQVRELQAKYEKTILRAENAEHQIWPLQGQIE